MRDALKIDGLIIDYCLLLHNSRPIERRAGSELRENFENLKKTEFKNTEIAFFKNSNLWDCCILASEFLMFVFVVATPA